MVTPTVLRTLPTKLIDSDLLEFAPLEVITRGDLRKNRVKSVKTLVGVAATAVVGVVLFRGFKEAQDHLGGQVSVSGNLTMPRALFGKKLPETET